MGIPQVVSVGALDMVNFGPPETVPEKFNGRKFHVHNASVTLMRTTPEENAKLGEEIGRKLAASKGPHRDPAAATRRLGHRLAPASRSTIPRPATALFDAIRRDVTASVELIELDQHINDRRSPRRPQRSSRRSSEQSKSTTAARGGVCLNGPIFPHQKSSPASAPKSPPASRSSAAARGPASARKCPKPAGSICLVIYNSGRFRMAGRGSLSGHDALRRRQRDRDGNGPRGAARRSAKRPCWPAFAAPIRFA